MAMEGGYDRAVYQEADALCFLPYEWWFARMTKPVACQPPCQHDFVDWNVTPFADLKWLKAFDFVGKYDWENQKPTHIGEQIWADIFGDNLQIIPCRGERVEGRLSEAEFRTKYADGCDWITHAAPELLKAALEINGFPDLMEQL